MKRSISSSVLLAVGCLAFFPIVAVPLLHSLFEGATSGVLAAVRTVIILAPTLGLGALYVQRARGKGETSLILATLGLPVIQLLFLGVGGRGFEQSVLYSAAVRSDANNLMLQQGIFRSDEGHYTADLDSLGFAATDGVEVELHGSDDGWSARLTHRLLGPDYACSVWGGRTEALAAGAGRFPAEPGQLLCYQIHRLSEAGTIGDALFGVHQRMDRLLDLPGG